MTKNSRPAKLATFVKNKLIDAIEGVVDTLNWLISCTENLTAGDGIKITGVQTGAPKIALNLKAGDGIELKQVKESDFDNSLTINAKGGSDLVCGPDSNISLTKTSDGKTQIDVYYV